jgi:kynureninase
VNPAEEMRVAAQRLRTRAAAATVGPWEHDGGGTISTHEADFITEAYHEADAKWIVLMSPEVADELARILDATASVVYLAQSLNTEHYAVLDFARLVNRKVITPRAAQEAR